MGLPVPGVRTHIFDIILGFPAQFSLSLGSVGIAGCNIAGTAGFDHIGDLHACSGFKILHNIKNTVAFTGTQVIDAEAGIVLDLLQRLYMAFGKIHHMDIVSHTGSVRSIIIVAEHPQFLQLAHSHLGDIGHQIIGDTVGVLSDGTALVSADGVEITQKYNVPFRICLLDV